MYDACRLCEKTSDLLKSHIIPEFPFQPLYDEKHRYTIVSRDGARNRYAQRGLTERLLCSVCEQQLSIYEGYAARLLTGSDGIRFIRQGNSLRIEGWDYQRFKLFLMSVLWRASVSSLQFFKLVSLGPREELLRKLLVSENPSDPEEFGCIVLHEFHDYKVISDTMFNPENMRWAGRRMIKIHFAGATWLFHCDKKQPAAHLRKFFLTKDGALTTMYHDIDMARLQFNAAKRFAKRTEYI